MWSLITLFLLSQVCLEHSAVLDDLVEAQLRDYDSQYRILQQLLAKECPGESIDKREEPGLLKLKLQVRILQVRNLREKLTKCQKEKIAATEPTTSTKPIQYPSSCPSYDGNTQLDIQLVSYNNPSNKKVFGKPCNAHGSPCRIFFEICVSPLNSLNCEFHYLVTDVVGSKSSINLIGTSGSQLNPLKIDLGNRKWEGVRVSFTALHKSVSNRLSGNNVVDEFDYNVTIPQGTSKVEHLHGKRPVDQSELIVLFAVPCATSTTSAPTTPTTTSATTTPIANASATTTPISNASATTTPLSNASATTTPISNASATTTPISNASATTTPIANASATTKPTTNAFPIPSECKTATNLTQYWRQNHDGEGILGGGSHAHPEGHACDLHEDLVWFRFTGAAGTHMLDTCPKAKSCGTSHPIWTDAAYPQATGVEAEISAHVITEVNCKFWTLPMLVMRCSLDKENDFIYQYIGNKFSSCTFAFCGTN